MSISLNNHETRIKALENMFLSSGFVKETMLYSGSSNVNITLNGNVNNYDAVVLYTESRTDIGDCRYIPKSLYNKYLCGEYGSSVTMSTLIVKDNVVQFETNFNKSTYIKYVVGLKWGGGINFGTLLKRFLVYIKTYSKLFHLQFLEVK